jgi:NTP pyrophosphatase (non-canonical NTP hydrolase)
MSNLIPKELSMSGSRPTFNQPMTLEDVRRIQREAERDYVDNRVTLGAGDFDELCLTAQRGIKAMSGTDPSTYQRLAARTECDQVRARGRLCGMVVSPPYGDLLAVRLNHAVIGLMGEVGELASAIEKAVYYGRGMDYVKGPNLVEELGDVLWYVALACNAAGLSLGAVMEANLAKLRERYPDKYEDERAAEEGRDRAREERALKAEIERHRAGLQVTLVTNGSTPPETPHGVALARLVKHELGRYKDKVGLHDPVLFDLESMLGAADAVLEAVEAAPGVDLGGKGPKFEEGPPAEPKKSQEEAIGEVPGGKERLEQAGHKRENYGASSDSDFDAE